MTFMTPDIYDTADFPKAPRVRLGAIMTKLGFIKERKGHDCRRGYWVREHLLLEINGCMAA